MSDWPDDEGMARGGLDETAPTRDRIRDLVQQVPGIHRSEVCRILGIGWGTAGHHIRRLEGEGVIQSRRNGRRVMLYMHGLDAREVQCLSILRDDACASIVEHLMEQPGQGLMEIARETGFSRKVVRRFLDVLRDQELVVDVGSLGRRYRVSQDGAAVAEHVGNGMPDGADAAASTRAPAASRP